MYCTNCGTEIEADSKYCRKCGVAIVSLGKGTTSGLKCKQCGGTMTITDFQRKLFTCPYCGYSEILVDSETVMKQKIQGAVETARINAQRDVEIARLKNLGKIKIPEPPKEYVPEYRACAAELREKLHAIDNESVGLGARLMKGADVIHREKALEKAMLIRGFVVTSHINDLFEVLELCEQNISIRLSKHGLINNFNRRTDMQSDEAVLSDAWVSLYMRVYDRIERLYSQDKRFPRVKVNFERRVNKLKIQRSHL